MVAYLQVLDAGPHLFDYPGALMTDHGGQFQGNLAIDDRQIRAAHAGSLDVHHDLAG